MSAKKKNRQEVGKKTEVDFLLFYDRVHGRKNDNRGQVRIYEMRNWFNQRSEQRRPRNKGPSPNDLPMSKYFRQDVALLGFARIEGYERVWQRRLIQSFDVKPPVCGFGRIRIGTFGFSRRGTISTKPRKGFLTSHPAHKKGELRNCNLTMGRWQFLLFQFFSLCLIFVN